MFCEKCGGILIPSENGKELECKKCNYKIKIKDQEFTIKEEVKINKDVEVIDKDIRTMPKVEEECPQCHNHEAYFWSMQTRGSDEPETTFYECTKCKHRWRKYA